MRVLQTWDDGLESDLRLIEILRRHQARASFCLTPGLYHDTRSCGWVHENREIRRLSIHELREAYAGFEICSHSLTHPSLTDLPAEALQREIRTSRELLEDIFQQPVTGFCYPFNAYNDFVKESVRAAGYRWGRGREHREHVFPPADALEFHPTCHFLDHDFWRKYDMQRHGEGVFFFWGHSCELTDEAAWEHFERMIVGISLDPVSEWVRAGDMFP